MAYATKPYITSKAELKSRYDEEGLVDSWDLSSVVNNTVIGVKGFVGTLNGGPVVVDTPLCKGMLFDGADDYINVYAGRITDSLYGYISCWVKFNTLASNYSMVAFGGSGAVNYGFLILQVFDAGGGVYYIGIGQRSDGSATVNRVRGSTVIRTNHLYHVVIVSNGDAWGLYVDGRPETITLTSGMNNGNWFGDTVVTAPSRTTLASVFYNGVMAVSAYVPGVMIEPKISNKILTDQEARNLYLRAKTALWRTEYGPAVSSADRGGNIGECLESTPLQFSDATIRARVETASILGTANCKVVACRTAAGAMGINTSVFQQNTTEAAFGTWEFYFYKGADANVWRLMLAAAVNGAWNAAGQNGYLFEIDANEAVKIQRITAGAVASTLMQTANAFITNSTWYKATVSRTTAGIVTLKINDDVASVTGGSGANPSAADVTHTTSSWLVFDPDVGDILGYSCLSGSRTLIKRAISL